MFGHARREETGIVWGLIGAVFPALAEHFDRIRFVEKIWQRLLAVERLVMMNPMQAQPGTRE